LRGSLADLPDGGVDAFLKNKREEVERGRRSQDSEQDASRESERVAHVPALRGTYATSKISSYAFIDEQRREVEREAADEQGRA